MERKATAPTNWGFVLFLALILTGAAALVALTVFIQARKKQLQKEGQEKTAAQIVRDLADGFINKLSKSEPK